MDRGLDLTGLDLLKHKLLLLLVLADSGGHLRGQGPGEGPGAVRPLDDLGPRGQVDSVAPAWVVEGGAAAPGSSVPGRQANTL